jgi:hypothetical protein
MFPSLCDLANLRHLLSRARFDSITSIRPKKYFRRLPHQVLVAVMSEVHLGPRNEFRNRELYFCFRLCRMRYLLVSLANGHIQGLCDSTAPTCLTAALSMHSRQAVGYNATISFWNEKSKSNIRPKNIGCHTLLNYRCSNFNQVLHICVFPNVYKTSTKCLCIILARYGPQFDTLNSGSCSSGHFQWEMSKKFNVE